ncbi:MAG: hypothetical protein ACREOU_05070 [Candidatus Eiseniibacteriota bacterium]
MRDRLPRGRPALPLLFAAAALVRAPLLAAPPTLSDDVYRYVLDGRLAWLGVNALEVPPRDLERFVPAERLAMLSRDSVLVRVNHPHLASIYPPVAEGAFALLARAGAGPRGFRIAFALCDLVATWALARLLARRGHSPWGAVLFALHPLSALESAGSGHADAFAVALLALTWERSEAGGRTASALAWCGAALVRPMALLAGPFQFARWGLARSILAAFVAACGLLGLVLASRAAGEASGALAFAQHWRHNDLLYAGALALGLPVTLARAAGFLAAGLVGAFLFTRRAPPVTAYAWCALLLLAFAPVLHPWYVLPLLVAAPALDGPGPRGTAFVLASVVLATYVVPGIAGVPLGPTPGFRILPIEVRVWELAPVALVGLWEVIRAGQQLGRPRGRPH